jgi:plasmid stabilization system protein ParE
MTKRAKPTDDKAPEDKFDIQRVRINRDGYDGSGAYWGAGPDVFIATTADGVDEITVRARNISDARDKVAAELARQPGTPKPKDDAIGGAAPRKTRYEINWRNPVTAETVRIRITHARDYLVQGTDHIEVESIMPKKAQLPVTATGYLSHFIPALQLINAGGPVTFVTAWIDNEARGKTWLKQAATKAQGDLFQWAEARKEVGARKKAKPQPSKPAPAQRKRPTRTRAPE